MNAKRLLELPLYEVGEELKLSTKIEKMVDKKSYSHELDSLIDLEGLRTELKSVLVFNNDEDQGKIGMAITSNKEARNFLEKVKYGVMLLVDDSVINMLKKRFKNWIDNEGKLNNINTFFKRDGRIKDINDYVTEILVRRSVSVVGLDYRQDGKSVSWVIKSPGKHAMITNFGLYFNAIFLRSGVAEWFFEEFGSFIEPDLSDYVRTILGLKVR